MKICHTTKSWSVRWIHGSLLVHYYYVKIAYILHYSYLDDDNLLCRTAIDQNVIRTFISDSLRDETKKKKKICWGFKRKSLVKFSDTNFKIWCECSISSNLKLLQSVTRPHNKIVAKIHEQMQNYRNFLR